MMCEFLKVELDRMLSDPETRKQIEAGGESLANIEYSLKWCGAAGRARYLAKIRRAIALAP